RQVLCTCSMAAVLGVKSRLFFVWEVFVARPRMPALRRNVSTHFCVDENRFGKWAPWPTEINLIYLFIFGCQYTGFKHKTVGIIACCGRCGNIRVAKTFYRATEKISGRRAEDEICRPVYEAFLQIDTCASLREIECVLVAE